VSPSGGSKRNTIFLIFMEKVLGNSFSLIRGLYHKLFYQRIILITRKKKEMKTNYVTTIAILLAAIICVGMVYPLSRIAYAHTFSGGESASFLALSKQISSEVELAQSNIPSNITLAQDHANDAREHLDANTTKELSERNKRVASDLNTAITDLQKTVNSTSASPTNTTIKDKVDRIDGLLQEALSVRIEPDQMKNATVHILAINNILNEIGEHYGGAYGIEPEKENQTTATQNKIVNMADYQSAESLAKIAVQMFNDVKKFAPSNVTSSPDFAKIGTGLTSLKSAIDSKKSFKEVQQIIDNQIRPNIESAFSLKINAK
jgi:hypothetical protein